MFTGIVSEVGRIQKIQITENSKIFTIKAPKASQELKIGSSIALNGACHTVVKKVPQAFIVESMLESLQRTNLKNCQIHDLINLELPLKVTDRFEGHIVSGHIDGTAKITKFQKIGRMHLCELQLPAKFTQLIVPKGSITLDGISLTVITVTQNKITIGIIPHTLNQTNLKSREIGAEVNFEIDLLAKHLQKLSKPLASCWQGW